MRYYYYGKIIIYSQLYKLALSVHIDTGLLSINFNLRLSAHQVFSSSTLAVAP